MALQIQCMEEPLLLVGEGGVAEGGAVLALTGLPRVDHQRLMDGPKQTVHPRRAQVDPLLMERPLQQRRKGQG